MLLRFHHVFNVQNKLEELEKELIETNGNMERLQRSYAELVELQLVLEKAGSFMSTSTKFDMTPESFDRGYIGENDAPLLEAAVSKNQANHVKYNSRRLNLNMLC